MYKEPNFAPLIQTTKFCSLLNGILEPRIVLKISMISHPTINLGKRSTYKKPIERCNQLLSPLNSSYGTHGFENKYCLNYTETKLSVFIKQ